MTRARDVADKNLAVISAGNSGQILTSDGTNWSAQNAPITELADDTSPALGGDLTMGSHSIADGVLPVKNTGTQSELRLYCEVGNAHYVGLKAPAHSAFSGNHSITMPPNTGNADQVLRTDGNGVTSWVDAAAGGSRTLISSTDMAGASTVSRTSDFSTTYSRYEVELRQYHLDFTGAGVSETYGTMNFIDDQGTILTGGSNVYTTQMLNGDYGGATGRTSWFWQYFADTKAFFGKSAGNNNTLKDQNGRYYYTSMTVFDPAKALVESGDTINSTTNQVNAKLYHQGAGRNSILEFSETYLTHDSQARRITGFRFALNDGSFSSGKLLVWGVGS